MTDADSSVPDGVPLGLEIEVFADDLDLPLANWQRMVLLRWFPDPAGEASDG